MKFITPVFKNRPSNLQKHSFTARPAVKINVNEVELTIFKGTNSVLASDIVKVVIRYAQFTKAFFYGTPCRKN